MAKQQGPLCRCCGKPVPKKTVWKSWMKYEDAPKTKAEAAARSNLQLVSASVHSYHADGSEPFIFSATYWDGESYQWDGHFHAQSCAAEFGRWAAGTDMLKDWAMPPYHEAMAARRAKQRKEDKAA